MKKKNKRIFWRILLLFILAIFIVWLALVLFEYSRVNKDQKPLICFNEQRTDEDDDEYSKECFGILYKYKEYYYKFDDSMSGRELVMFFKDYERDVTKNH